MARRIRKMIRQPATRRVDWSRFTNGRAWELEAGEDFVQDAPRAARAARMWATNNGFTCTAIATPEGNLQVKFTKKAD